MSADQIDVVYELYTRIPGSPPTFERVTTAADLELERALRDSDTSPWVESSGTVEEQTILLHEHVLGVPFDFPVHGHVIVFDNKEESRWDRTAKTWVVVIQGASLAYAVMPPGGDPENPPYCLQARTSNTDDQAADAQGDDALIVV